jgi:hypothetical protein
MGRVAPEVPTDPGAAGPALPGARLPARPAVRGGARHVHAVPLAALLPARNVACPVAPAAVEVVGAQVEGVVDQPVAVVVQAVAHLDSPRMDGRIAVVAVRSQTVRSNPVTVPVMIDAARAKPALRDALAKDRLGPGIGVQATVWLGHPPVPLASVGPQREPLRREAEGHVTALVAGWAGAAGRAIPAAIGGSPEVGTPVSLARALLARGARLAVDIAKGDTEVDDPVAVQDKRLADPVWRAVIAATTGADGPQGARGEADLRLALGVCGAALSEGSEKTGVRAAVVERSAIGNPAVGETSVLDSTVWRPAVEKRPSIQVRCIRQGPRTRALPVQAKLPCRALGIALARDGAGGRVWLGTARTQDEDKPEPERPQTLVVMESLRIASENHDCKESNREGRIGARSGRISASR